MINYPKKWYSPIELRKLTHKFCDNSTADRDDMKYILERTNYTHCFVYQENNKSDILTSDNTIIKWFFENSIRYDYDFIRTKSILMISSHNKTYFNQNKTYFLFFADFDSEEYLLFNILFSSNIFEIVER